MGTAKDDRDTAKIDTTWLAVFFNPVNLPIFCFVQCSIKTELEVTIKTCTRIPIKMLEININNPLRNIKNITSKKNSNRVYTNINLFPFIFIELFLIGSEKKL